MIEIQYVGGGMDGRTEIHNDNLPDTITFPTLSSNPSYLERPDTHEIVMIYENTVYRRLQDTNIYVCIQEPK